MKKQMGFTLIEIVMVLVLLGILSAIAVPKYFDLRAQAEDKAMAATAAEYQARLNAKFASELLKDTACTTAVTEGIKEANTMTGGIDSEDATLSTDTTFSFVKLNETSNPTTATTDLTVKSANSSKTFKIAVPQCQVVSK